MKHQPQGLILLSMLKIALMSWLVSGSNTSNGSPSPYSSVRALDKYGQTQQLTHAREAALKGRKIIAASNGETTVVVSKGKQPILHSINLPILESPNVQEKKWVVGICCSGIKGDASWLISQVQQYVGRVWERYNHHEIASPAIAHYISRLLGSFLQMYDLENEWQAGVRREAAEWARPLGVQTMILSSSDPNILILDPSGRITKSQSDENNSKWSFGGIGMTRNLVPNKLSAITSKGRHPEVDEIIQQLIAALCEANPKSGNSEISVEILSLSGIERRVIELKNGKQSSTPASPME